MTGSLGHRPESSVGIVRLSGNSDEWLKIVDGGLAEVFPEKPPEPGALNGADANKFEPAQRSVYPDDPGLGDADRLWKIEDQLESLSRTERAIPLRRHPDSDKSLSAAMSFRFSPSSMAAPTGCAMTIRYVCRLLRKIALLGRAGKEISFGLIRA